MLVVADHFRKQVESFHHVVLEALAKTSFTLEPLLDLREVRHNAFLRSGVIHDVNGVSETAEVTTSGRVPIKRVGPKRPVFTQKFTDDFSYKNGSRSVYNLEFL